MLLATAALICTACSPEEAVAAGPHDRLDPDITYSADLDGDSADERILIDGTTASLTISDGETTYRSRDRWQIVEAYLGDTDRDGLLEVVTLVDDEQGRHLGLFAHFGGEYRERLVTSEIVPRPVGLEIVDYNAGLDPSVVATLTGDAVLLTLEAVPSGSEPQTVLCRWNGFGFTGIESGP